MKVNLSIILPVYNEQLRIKEGIKKCQDFLKNHGPRVEIILVNDGSTDNTEQIIKRSIGKANYFRLISYSVNKGKGYAIKKGMKKARGKLILFSDIDFSAPLSEFNKFLVFIKNDSDIVIGTRKTKGANLIKRQNKIREWLGKSFTILANFILGLRISDFTCGFKIFKREAAKIIFSKMQIGGWGFDAEALFLAKKFNFKVSEIPVAWTNDERTKVRLQKDIINSLIEILKIRINEFMGKYE